MSFLISGLSVALEMLLGIVKRQQINLHCRQSVNNTSAAINQWSISLFRVSHYIHWLIDTRNKTSNCEFVHSTVAIQRTLSKSFASIKIMSNLYSLLGDFARSWIANCIVFVMKRLLHKDAQWTLLWSLESVVRLHRVSGWPGFQAGLSAWIVDGNCRRGYRLWHNGHHVSAKARKSIRVQRTNRSNQLVSYSYFRQLTGY